MIKKTTKEELKELRDEVELLRTEVKNLVLEVHILCDNLKREKEKAKI